MPALPTIALIGRANVGKSTLFNCLMEEKVALTSPVAGTTRDRQEGHVLWRGQVVRFLDTGGLDIKHPDDIEKEIVRQAHLAAEEADIVILLLDATVGPLPFDKELYRRVQKIGKPVVIVANKCDTAAAKKKARETWRFPGGEPWRISSIRGEGTGDLLDHLYDRLSKLGKPPAPLSDVVPTRVAVIGKPNVGKSSLLNTLLGKPRFIASPVAHTTRAPNDVAVEHDNHPYVFVDTAGIRRRVSRESASVLEKAGVEETRRTLRKTDVVLFVVDATDTIGVQEKVLAGEIEASGAGVIVVVNKWDLVEEKKTDTIHAYRERIMDHLPTLAFAPLIFVSAKTGQRVSRLFSMITEAQKNRFAEFDDEAVESFLRQAIARHRPTKGMGTAPPKIVGMRQIATTPPTFVIAVKSRHTKKLHTSYVRYLENRLRETFPLSGTPVRLVVKAVAS